MKLITIDFETFYDKEFSLSKLSTEEYIRDKRFEVIGVSIKERHAEPQWYTGDDVEKALAQYNWDKCAVLAHNTMFDGAILSWRYGIRAGLWLDTLSMARPLHGSEVGGSLAALSKHYGLGEKGTEVVNALGKRRKDFSKEELAKYGEYCKNDVALTHALFHILGSKVSKKELEIIDLTLRMFVEPVLELDGELLRTHLKEVVDRQEKLISLAQADRATLMSNEKFAAKLYELGVEPPTKISPTTGKPTLALAKTDEAFKALAEHPDEKVQALVAARLGNKSTIEQTRTERFIEVSKRGTLPIPLKYYAAHTGRWGGTDKLNLQNLPSRGANKNKLKRAIKAPEGYVIIDCDSSQIEARTVAWLAGQNDLVEAFANKQDVYKIMASQIYSKNVEDITPEERFVGKWVVLGAGYGLGGAKLQVQLKTAGIDVPLDECKRIISVYRDKAFKIKELWGTAQKALTHILMDERMWLGREGVLLVDGAKGILLPSGYYLNYEKLKVESSDNGEQFTYISRKGKAGVETKIYGGKVVENICQAVARCVIAEQMLLINKRYRPVLTVHDAIAVVAPKAEAEDARAYVEQCMRWVPAWATGLPLDCESGMAERYGDC